MNGAARDEGEIEVVMGPAAASYAFARGG